MIGAYLHTLDASEVKTDDQLGDMYRRITCRSREVCCQHTWRTTFRSLVTPCLVGKQGRETCARKVRLTYIATWPQSLPSTVAPPISSTKLLIAMARRIVGALGCSRRTPCPKSYMDCHLNFPT